MCFLWAEREGFEPSVPGGTLDFESSTIDHSATSPKTCGGETGIRTLDTLLTYTHFPGALLKPLGHLSGIGCKQPSKNTTFGIRKHLFPKAGAKVILVSANCKRDFAIKKIVSQRLMELKEAHRVFL